MQLFIEEVLTSNEGQLKRDRLGGYVWKLDN